MRILGFGGSLREASKNRALLDEAAALAPAGAARAWWPIQSSKLAGPGSPRLGRFDSFAASWTEIVGCHG